MIPLVKLLLQAAETKSRESTDHGSQLLTNTLHDYRAERIMENLHWLLLVVVIGKGSGGRGRGGGWAVEEGCKKVIKTRFFVYHKLMEDFCTENIITRAKVKKPKMRMLGKNPQGTFLQIRHNSTCFVGEKPPWYGEYIRLMGFAFALSHK